MKTPSSARRSILLFAATTLVPAGSLGWLGWRMVEQDRLLENQRAQERRDHAADLAAAALQRILAEAEEKLTAFHASPSGTAGSAGDGVALVAFGSGGLLARAGTALPYYPAIPAPAPPDESAFVPAEEMEFRKRDLAGAIRALDPLVRSRDAAVRREALLRLARIYRKREDVERALETFRLLASLDGLRARQGRGLLLESAGRTAELEREAAALCEDLENGRWLLARSEFEFSYEQARKWLGTRNPPPLDPDRLALAEAVESQWQEWNTASHKDATARGRRTLRPNDRSVLALSRFSPSHLSLLLISPRFLTSQWQGDWRAPDMEFALSDAEGRTVLGRADAPLTVQSLRPASATQLPWTIHAISRAGSATPQEVSGRTRLLLLGIAMMAVLVIAGGYWMQRAIQREITVARLQSDFVAAVSHEFRTPLTTVRQLSEMLVRGRVSSDERRQQFYETLLRESERLHRLVEGLLNFGRMEAGQLQYRFEAVDAQSFVKDVVADFQREVSGLGYTIEFQGNGSLPPIRADRESLARVFWNLLDNAVKYSPEQRTVWVDLAGAGKRIMVQVRDRGLGIPASEQKEIFRKFVRGAASKTASIRGTGVGLAMASQIVAAHGGNISVESAPGEGSVFTVLLPVVES